MQLSIKGQTYQLPLYSPDATLGVVRNLDSRDLKAIGLQSLMINSYHLQKQPGLAVLEKFGGIKKLMNWPGLLSSDSGGFQIFSLINKNPELGKLTDDGIVLYSGSKKRKKKVFTPEESIQLQFSLGSDIMICLDDFTPPDADEARIKLSVERTLAWAKRARQEFDLQLKQHNFSNFSDQKQRPLLLAPIQGHKHPKWRQYCAEGLLEVGFDLYGLGGWPFHPAGKFDYDFCRFNVSLTPDQFPRFALGVGTPSNIVQLFFMGYQLFDCVLPTRDARHQRLYVFKVDPEQLDRQKLETLANSNQLDQIFSHLYIGRGVFAEDPLQLDEFCDCPVCQKTDANSHVLSRAYLHHLFKVGDAAAFRLASIHNLRHYTKIMEILAKED